MNTALIDSIVQLIQTLSPQEQHLLIQKLPHSQIKELSLEARCAFLKKPIAERRAMLAREAEGLIDHYEHSSEWRDLMAGDIIDG
jgi:hypothetical protein